MPKHLKAPFLLLLLMLALGACSKSDDGVYWGGSSTQASQGESDNGDNGSGDNDNGGSDEDSAPELTAILVLAPYDSSSATVEAWGKQLTNSSGLPVAVGFTNLTSAGDKKNIAKGDKDEDLPAVQTALGAALAINALAPDRVTVFELVADASGQSAAGMQNEAKAALGVLAAPSTLIEGFGCTDFMTNYLTARVAVLTANQSVDLGKSALIVAIKEDLTIPDATISALEGLFKSVSFVTAGELATRVMFTTVGLNAGRKLVVPYLCTPADLAEFTTSFNLVAGLPKVMVDRATILEDSSSLSIIE